MVKIRFICTSLLILIVTNLNSQSISRSVISIAGISSEGNNGIFSFTTGEPVSGCLMIPTNCVTQGFQQPALRNFFDRNAAQLEINAVEIFPNPVVSDLILLFNIRLAASLTTELYSGSGTLFRTDVNQISESGSIIIEMNAYPSGMYLLHVFTNDKAIDRVFKIEKM